MSFGSYEENLLLFCAQKFINSDGADLGKLLIRETIDWAYLIQTSHRHGLLPILYKVLKTNYSEKVPEEILDQLKDHFRNNALRNLFLTGELFNILDFFETNQIPAISFKGPVLATLAYGDLTLREFDDLDILVRKKDVLKAKTLLISKGYQPALNLTNIQEVTYLRSDCEFYFNRKIDRVQIEIHWEIAPKCFSFPIDTKILWNRLKPVPIAGHEILTFLPEDLLLILCVHGSKHRWEQLKWILDIAALLNMYKNIDWDRVIKQARQLRCERIYLLGLFLVRDLFGAYLPPGVLRKLEREPVIKWLTAKVREHLFSNVEGSLELFETHLFYIRMREKMGDKIRYFLHRYFTPNIEDWKFLRLPDSLFLLYFLIRPIRLATNYSIELLRYIINSVHRQKCLNI
jgi:hypothetical protein